MSLIIERGDRVNILLSDCKETELSSWIPFNNGVITKNHCYSLMLLPTTLIKADNSLSLMIELYRSYLHRINMNSKFCILVGHSWISTYINTKMSVCLSVHVFLGHFETDWETLCHKLAFCSRECSKTIIFFKMLFFKELLPFFYISLRFLCNFEERL